MSKQWIIHGHTESSDHFVYLVKARGKPSKALVDAFLCEQMPDEYRELGFTLWDLTEADDADDLDKFSPSPATLAILESIRDD